MAYTTKLQDGSIGSNMYDPLRHLDQDHPFRKGVQDTEDSIAMAERMLMRDDADVPDIGLVVEVAKMIMKRASWLEGKSHTGDG